LNVTNDAGANYSRTRKLQVQTMNLQMMQKGKERDYEGYSQN
jgi:hypothetical protein